MLDHTLKSDLATSRLEVITETGRRRWFLDNPGLVILGDPLAYLTNVLTRIVNGRIRPVKAALPNEACC